VIKHCEICGLEFDGRRSKKYGKHIELHAHHVFTFADFPEHRFNIWNGVTLCIPCHGKIHPNLKARCLDEMRENTA